MLKGDLRRQEFVPGRPNMGERPGVRAGPGICYSGCGIYGGTHPPPPPPPCTAGPANCWLKKRALLEMRPKRLDLAPIVRTFIPRLWSLGFIFWKGGMFTVPGSREPLHAEASSHAWCVSLRTYLPSRATYHSLKSSHLPQTSQSVYLYKSLGN